MLKTLRDEPWKAHSSILVIAKVGSQHLKAFSRNMSKRARGKVERHKPHNFFRSAHGRHRRTGL